MQNIVADADAGLMEFCAAALPVWVAPWIMWWRRLFPWEIYGPLAKTVEQNLERFAGVMEGLGRRHEQGVPTRRDAPAPAVPSAGPATANAPLKRASVLAGSDDKTSRTVR
jgi:hypothetical protein